MSLPAVLITGGAVRIGAAMARRFAEAGWHVVIHYRSSSEEADALATALPSAETIGCDLNDGDAAVAMVETLATKLPNWAALINSASVFNYDGVTELDPATNREAMQVNAVTPARMAQAYLAKASAEKGRRVIHITDQKLENSNPDFFSYTMSKHALDATIAMLAFGHSDSSDRIYGLAPGAILASHDQTEDEIELSHKLNPLKRKTGADEIAEAALFLATGNLRSGETLYIDSGQHLLNQKRDVIYLAREMAGQT
ncbi:SDR family oxidoreductase [Altererythrobacter lutimaris]|uniref:SDR family oxidoreductase n=1 Tax=Altererythrobacter lutimaris TaxID=2743979 RepID=A0A850H9C5_9SPHN|nr:SDR family oxidoreductase [Altererythrobacter lutimaris]NVE94100.1 SDR family oxidoreductase [Altererythrobacter lutimaris]